MRDLRFSSRINQIVVASCFLLAAVTGCGKREAYQLLSLANDYETDGYVGKAIETYGLAVDADPKDAYLQRVLGRAFLRRRDYDRARAAFREAVSLEPAFVFGGMDGSELSTQLSGVVVEGGIAVPSLSPRLAWLLAVILLGSASDC